MNKLITSFAALALATTAFAADHDFSYTVDPAEGSVSILQFVTMTFQNLDEIEINSSDDLTVQRADGSRVRGVDVSVEDDNKLAFVFGAEQTDPGTYTINIPAGSLAGYADNYEWMEDNPTDIVLTYKIGNQGAEGIDWTCQTDPAVGSVEELQNIYLYFPNITVVDINSKSDIVLSYNGTPIDGVKISEEDANLFRIYTPEPQTAAGTYTLSIAKYALCAFNDEESYPEDLPNELTFTWTIDGAASDTPVEYDLQLAISSPRPNADGQISAEKSLESIFFVCEEKNLVTAEGSEIEVTLKEDNGNFSAKGRLRKTNGLNANYSYFSVSFGKEPSYNGKYTITIPKGAFGNEVWAQNPKYGRSNDEIKLSFELIDGVDYDTYSLEPVKIDPEEGTYRTGQEIATITLTFAEGVSAVKGASATLAGVDNSYAETAEFKAVDGGFAVTFGSTPSQSGNYMLTVSQGMFGDEDFVKTGTGKASAPISIKYTIDHSSGVCAIEADKEGVIYNLQGVPVNATVDHLPAGVYVIDGKKVMINK
ncbi:MAG: hypothetical protein K2H38_10200 [Muribaculaceae bacterium]|nr:hypothetical protein [Muribaculaceae bacterium]